MLQLRDFLAKNKMDVSKNNTNNDNLVQISSLAGPVSMPNLRRSRLLEKGQFTIRLL